MQKAPIFAGWIAAQQAAIRAELRYKAPSGAFFFVLPNRETHEQQVAA
jgi:hypothetical protein